MGKNTKQDPMRALIEEQLSIVRMVTDRVDGEPLDLEEWWREGATLAEVVLSSDEKELVSYAIGYLHGCAEFADLTFFDMLDEYDLLLDGPRRTISVRPVALASSNTGGR